MWLPGAGVGGDDLTAKNAKSAKKREFTTETQSTRSSEYFYLRIFLSAPSVPPR
jgi:hypothetical protein